ncbi:MAG: hypothetical protein IJ559_09505 [Prevotella sp.]|nr:hypothetical protein [Prevotella sp.]
MKTKTILKTLALAMLMPTMLLTTACSNNDDEIINSENTASTKGYALPITINVTRQGDTTTRAAYDGENKKLNFSTGDQLLVNGTYSEGDDDMIYFSGVLTWQSEGKFSGVILTQKEYSGTADDLLSSTGNVNATLLPAGYESYGYLSIAEEGTCTAYVDYDPSKAYALTKAAAVEQFSDECADSYSNGFALSPQNAIVSFTISGLTANTAVAVLFKDNYDTSATPVNITTDESGVATFASAMHDNDNFDDYSLTVGGNAITLPANKEVEAGKIYNVSRSVAPAGPTYPVALSAVTADYLGSVVTTDGNVYATVADATAASKTAAAVIAYVSGTGTGLAIALSDESSKANMGTLLSKINNMSHTPTVSGQTWKLPKEDEWKQMFSANGGSNSSYSGLNTAITNAGGSALQASDYWVAHNTSTSNMTKMTLSAGNASFGSGGAFNSYYVRVGFAF